MRTLRDIKELDGKKVFLRVDFNAVDGERITGTFRIKSHKKTIDYLLDKGARVVLVSHITGDGSFEMVQDKIAEILEKEINFIGNFDADKVSGALEKSRLVLVDNIRHDEREKENDEEFAKELAQPFDIYVNDAFSVSHREHASLCAIAKFLPAYAGFAVEKEIEGLSSAFDEALHPRVVVIGGAKVDVKTNVVKKFLETADSVLIGGLVMVNFFKAKGYGVGISPVDEEALKNIKEIDLDEPRLVLPTDVMISDDIRGKGTAEPFPAGDIDRFHAILDIGPESAEYFAGLIRHAKLVVWNGPMGLFEVKDFANGTITVAKAVADCEGYSIVGGGDSIAFFEENDLVDKYDFVSTGGGAMLEYLAGNKLPGLEILNHE